MLSHYSMLKRSKSFSASESDEFGAMMDSPVPALPNHPSQSSSVLLHGTQHSDPKLFPSNGSIPMIRANTGTLQVTRRVSKGLHEEVDVSYNPKKDDLSPTSSTSSYASTLLHSFPLPPSASSSTIISMSKLAATQGSSSSASSSSPLPPPPATATDRLSALVLALPPNPPSCPAPALPLPPLPKGPSGFRGFGLESSQAAITRRASLNTITSLSNTTGLHEKRVYASVSTSGWKQVVKLQLSAQSLSSRNSFYPSHSGVDSWGMMEETEMLADESDMDEEDGAQYTSRFTQPAKQLLRPSLAPLQYPPKRPGSSQSSIRYNHRESSVFDNSMPSPTSSTFSHDALHDNGTAARSARSESPDLAEVMKKTPKPRRKVKMRTADGSVGSIVSVGSGRPNFRRAISASDAADGDVRMIGSSASETESDIDLVTDLPVLAVKAGIIMPSSRLLSNKKCESSGWSGSESEEEVLYEMRRRTSSISNAGTTRSRAASSSAGYTSPQSSSRFSVVSNDSTSNSSVYSAPSLYGSKEASRLSVSSNEGGTLFSSSRNSGSSISSVSSSFAIITPAISPQRMSVVMNGRPLPLPKKDSGLDFGPFEEPKNQDEYDEYEAQQKIIRGSIDHVDEEEKLASSAGIQTPKPSTQKPLFLRPQTTQIASIATRQVRAPSITTPFVPQTPGLNRRSSASSISTVNYLRRPSEIKPLTITNTTVVLPPSAATTPTSSSRLRKPSSMADIRSQSLNGRKIFVPASSATLSTTAAPPSAFNASRLPSLSKRPSFLKA